MMDHTPTVPASDDRPLRLLERTPVAPEHKARLLDLVRAAQAVAAADGAELQSEFGAEHVGLIVGCNQFARLFRGGPEPGAVELRIDAPDKARLEAAGFALRPPDGAVFKLFGWIRLDPMQGDPKALEAAVGAAFAKAKAAKPKGKA
ncbi:MAG: hypothetical protein QOD77_417 [Thermoplasmata archaeon]|jgi:hypothetical protein|nr:hypothetical protein [Thermoplasmata archaeon]